MSQLARCLKLQLHTNTAAPPVLLSLLCTAVEPTPLATPNDINAASATGASEVATPIRRPRRGLPSWATGGVATAAAAGASGDSLLITPLCHTSDAVGVAHHLNELSASHTQSDLPIRLMSYESFTEPLTSVCAPVSLQLECAPLLMEPHVLAGFAPSECVLVSSFVQHVCKSSTPSMATYQHESLTGSYTDGIRSASSQTVLVLLARALLLESASSRPHQHLNMFVLSAFLPMPCSKHILCPLQHDTCEDADICFRLHGDSQFHARH